MIENLGEFQGIDELLTRVKMLEKEIAALREKEAATKAEAVHGERLGEDASRRLDVLLKHLCDRGDDELWLKMRLNRI